MELELNLAELRKFGMQHPAIYADLISAGEICGDSLRIKREKFDEVNRKHFQPNAIGTIIHKVIEPAAQILDQILGTDLAKCGACAQRELKLNALTLKDL